MTGDPVELRLEDVCFVHWPVAADELTAHVPDGTTPDAYDGRGWVSVVAMRVRPRFLPRTYAQLNVRTYLEGEPPAVHFLDVVVDEWLAVQGERALPGLPARYGHVTVAREQRRTRVQCIDHDGVLEFEVVPEGDPSTPEEGSLVRWLVERYRFVREDGSADDIEHPPWRIQAATGDVGRRGLLGELPDPAGEPVFGYSPGVVVEW